MLNENTGKLQNEITNLVNIFHSIKFLTNNFGKERTTWAGKLEKSKAQFGRSIASRLLDHWL
jgi:hypothetical protein